MSWKVCEHRYKTMLITGSEHTEYCTYCVYCPAKWMRASVFHPRQAMKSVAQLQWGPGIYGDSRSLFPHRGSVQNAAIDSAFSGSHEVPAQLMSCLAFHMSTTIDVIHCFIRCLSLLLIPVEGLTHLTRFHPLRISSTNQWP